ncbi:hypothetical protein WME89_00870 [Sorangium sp. So ce321]|uniref:PqqD family protein n=1 Tax=Sorangium sp. So ce321 TaxID=3133300 RepID=UPI003F5DB16F
MFVQSYDATVTSNEGPSLRGREGALNGLLAYLSSEQIEGAARCAARLHTRLPDKQTLHRNQVLVAYGGGKDSTYTIAFVRLMQLLLHRTYGDTFRLRVATNRHAGMPRAVMENIGRTYRALGILDDPLCEPLLVDGNEVKPFREGEPLPRRLVQRNRDDILMTGHRTSANGRPTFCNACNFGMVNAFGLAAAHGGGVDVIVTGDARREQRAYYVWVRRLAQKLGIDGMEGKGDFGGFLETMRNISATYFRDIHGEQATSAVEQRLVASEVRKELHFFSIYGDTDYESGAHWDLLTEHLGFTFDDIAFSFSESDCANPGLMAHLRGLRCERDHGRSYAEGIDEYVRFAVGLMRQKDFPEALVDMVLARYEGRDGVMRMRSRMNEVARELYGLEEEQLVCMVCSPFAGRGERLQPYLEREHPCLAHLGDAIHALLRGDPRVEGREATRAFLERTSGLTVPQLQVVYGAPRHDLAPGSADGHLITQILARDPHKQVIQTRHARGGPVVEEIISGR